LPEGKKDSDDDGEEGCVEDVVGCEEVALACCEELELEAVCCEDSAGCKVAVCFEEAKSCEEANCCREANCCIDAVCCKEANCCTETKRDHGCEKAVSGCCDEAAACSDGNCEEVPTCCDVCCNEEAACCEEDAESLISTPGRELRNELMLLAIKIARHGIND
jgi:hypothetical protein